MTAILDRKCWEFCTFLPIECPSRGFGTAMTPPLAPPWSKLFSRNQKWCSRTSTLFFFRLEGGVFVVASAFNSSILKLDMVTSIFLNILVLLLFSPRARASVFESSLIALKKPQMAGCETDENRKIDRGISLELRVAYGQRGHAS